MSRFAPSLAFLLVCLAAPVACGSSSVVGGVTPITGVLVRAETLIEGKGCGTGPTQVYRYAVVVSGYDGGGKDPNDKASYNQPIAGTTYDCFSDANFIDLTAVNGSNNYRLEVFAYDKAAYDAFAPQIEAAGTDASRLTSTAPTWTTECTALQRDEVEGLAECSGLVAGLGGLRDGTPAAPATITLSTTSFELPTGPASCGGGIGAAFDTARIRWRRDGLIGPTVDLTCPARFNVQVPPDPALYSVDVALLLSGRLVGQTVCTATTKAGATVDAVCPAAP